MIVITGAAGFIGSNLLAALEGALGDELVVCDRLGDGEKWRNIAKRELADFVPPEALFEFLNDRAGDVETVFHLGAVSSTVERDADRIVADNFRLSLRLWEWCAAHAVRLIYASSAATYGDGAAGFDDDPAPQALAALQPLNPYGWSKHAFDRRVARIVAGNGPTPPQWAWLKFFNVYGPNEYHKGGQRSVAVQLFEQTRDGGPARLFKSRHPDYADGGQQRDFIWVGDCADVMLWLHRTPQVSGLFNLGTGRARSFEDLALAVFAAQELEPRIEYIEMPEDLADRYQYHTCARVERLRAAGYQPAFTTLEDGVRRYIRDYLATPDPYA